MNTIKFLIRSSKMLLKSHLQYPGSFFWHTLATMVMTLGDLLAVLLLMNRFTRLGLWTAGDLILFFGLMQCAFAVTEFCFRGIANFGALVQSGRLDVMLVRPRSALLQVMAAELDPRRAGSILVGIAAIWMASASGGVAWTALKAVCLIWAMAGTSALSAGLFMIEAVCCFFSVKSIEAVNILTYGGKSACQYPIDIYPRPLRLLFLFVAPFALTAHVPVSYILDKPLWGASALGAFAAPAAGFAFFGLMTLVWRIGLKKYRSTGS